MTDSSNDSNDSTEIKGEERRGRKKGTLGKDKIEKYGKERKEILEKILEIIKDEKEGGTFTKGEMTEENVERVCKMLPEMKKYYYASDWRIRRLPDERALAISLIKHILKDNEIECMKTRKMKMTTIYNI